MKYIPWIGAGIGLFIGIILSSGKGEARFITGICTAGGYVIGELIKFAVRRSSDQKARQQGSDYTPEKWQEYKNDLKD